MNGFLCMLYYCKPLWSPYDKILGTAFDVNLQQRLQFVKQNFSKSISAFIKSFQLISVKAASKQTIPHSGQVSAAECLARECSISQGCGKKVIHPCWHWYVGKTPGVDAAVPAEGNFYRLSWCRLGRWCNYASRTALPLACAVSVGGSAPPPAPAQTGEGKPFRTKEGPLSFSFYK